MEHNDHKLNLRAVGKAMKKKPLAQRLYHFFRGLTDSLTVAQMVDIKKILTRDHEKTVAYIDGAIKEGKLREKKEKSKQRIK